MRKVRILFMCVLLRKYKCLYFLRHSFASYLLKAGCSMKEISDLLGHSDISTTMNFYVHLDMDSKKSAMGRLSNLLG